MREETLKLEKVKKSCKITARVAMVLEILMLSFMTVCIIGAIVCYSQRQQINSEIMNTESGMQEAESNNMKLMMNELGVGGVLKFTVNPDKMIENNEYAELASVACIMGGIVLAMVALIFDILRRLFKLINKSETPFEETVIKKIKVLFIVISVEILVMVGLGVAAVVALICWSIYNIMDYGFTLQKQIDETL